MSDYTWSFSSLKQYQNCPRQYHEIRVLQNYTVKESEAMIYGKEVHTALENYVKDGKELAKNYQRFQSMVDSLIEIPGKKLTELEMALTRDKKVCDFHDENRWVRGIADLVILDEDYAFVVDYKTGSNRYPDTKQLRLMALMLFEHFPEIKKVKAGLMFLKHKTFITEEYKAEDKSLSWAIFTKILSRLDHAYETDKWLPNPTPLCKWCSVKTCEFQRT
jgi:CRISPR/Cas system-associated exonuclease Cas4 (RecB family)|tara:strand:+ start:3055 stop:3711 length:657 start_codon:yes stop_codon:yes gene_type:complete